MAGIKITIKTAVYRINVLADGLVCLKMSFKCYRLVVYNLSVVLLTCAWYYPECLRVISVCTVTPPTLSLLQQCS